MDTQTKFPTQLKEWKYRIEGMARAYGLDFFQTIFEMVSYEKINEIASQGGFPTRYPHWRFGMEYEQLSKGYAYGLQKIYEMVINNNPCYAYLLDCNSLTDHKVVMAHVYGHCDFFKNNAWFAKTNRKMMDTMANHAVQIRDLMARHGLEKVEAFIDTCLSIENLIDYHAPFIRRGPAKRDDEPEPKKQRISYPAKPYMQEFINPPGASSEADDTENDDEATETTPEPLAESTRDVMGFVLENAPLKPWQRQVLATLREEAYYFAPQAQTKIMNEGWASYWHSKMMTGSDLTDGYQARRAQAPVLDASEIVDFADHHSGTLATSPGRINPYKLGIELYRDIERRWNKGQFGREWEECTDMRERVEWDTQAGLGRQKIFEARRVHNDISFIDHYLTREFCLEQKLFAFDYNKFTKRYEISDRDFAEVKRRLLASLTNFGQPIISVVHANYKNRGELLLHHHHEGNDLKLDYAGDTLRNLYKLWSRPVHIETQVDDDACLLSFDGHELTRTDGRAAAA
jgi:stage V sporulation protein R